MIRKRKKGCTLLLAAALLLGALPAGNLPVSNAEETLSPANNYGLKNPVVEAVAPPANTSHGLSNPRNENGTVTWDCVYFGNYWQSDTNGDGTADKNDEKEPIKWRVLSVDGDDAFLLADTNLDVQKYNDTATNVTWETCTMRSWLNGYGADKNVCGTDYSSNNFWDYAFTASEQQAVTVMDVVNEDNLYHGTEGGNDTQDKVYLLSYSEVLNPEYGFASAMDSTHTREAVNTAYAANGGEIKSEWMSSAGYADYWWLRSPGYYSSNASYVLSGGTVYDSGDGVHDNYNAVRPALHLNLSDTSVWSYAGTVSSAENEEEADSNPPSTSTPSVTPTPAPGSGTGSSSSVQSTVSSVSSSTSSAKNVQSQATASSKEKTGKVTGLKAKGMKKAVQASWKKVSSVDGYEVQISTSKKFKKKSVKSTKKTKLTIKKLKAKKKYFVRVRAYRVTNGKKIYGTWSKTVKVKTKKSGD